MSQVLVPIIFTNVPGRIPEATPPRWAALSISGPAFRLRSRRALGALGAAAALTLGARWLILGGVRATTDRPLLAYLRRWMAPWLVDALASMALPRGPTFIEPGEKQTTARGTEQRRFATGAER